jgi:AcrR family transcriptional regulator
MVSIPKATTQSGPASSAKQKGARGAARRQELIEAVTTCVLRQGLAGLTIRQVAAGVGVSHVALLHHFGSMEEMIAQVLANIRERQRRELLRQSQRPSRDPLRRFDQGWAVVSEARSLEFSKAFIEICGLAVRQPAPYGEFVDGIVNSWLPVLTSGLVDSGVPRRDATLLATLMQATGRGLLLDLLITGDRRRVEGSYRRFRAILKQELERLAAASLPA